MLKFSKYHALGNVYIVVNPEQLTGDISTAMIKNICHKNYGISSDGLLIGPLTSSVADFALRIFNPDGSEAEKSGNGLRIFCRYLWDEKLVGDESESPIVGTLGSSHQLSGGLGFSYLFNVGL